MRLLLVDGHYYLYRSFFAIRGLTNPRGEPTNAIFGFSKALRKMLADVAPTHAAVIWDCGLPAKRTELQPEYKQNRPPMPDEMRSQEDWLQDNVPLFGPASLWLQDTEADDLIASYTRMAASAGASVVIATNDKDILQMVGDGVMVYSTAKADCGTAGHALLGPDEVREKWGVNPGQIGDVLALTGDSSDNIPGIPGVGQKTAAKLIGEFGGVVGLYENIDSIQPEKLRDKLAAARDLVLDNLSMVTLDIDLPIPVPVEELILKPDPARLAEALRDCGFKSMVRELEDESHTQTPSSGYSSNTSAQTPLQGDLFRSS
ncbi:MAG: hypothetical protein Fur0032_13620 [Terrimicrobiaceae bacterium]